MLAAQICELSDALDNTEWVVFAEDCHRIVRGLANAKLLRKPRRQNLVEHCFSNGFVDHTGPGIQTGIKTVRAENVLAEAVNGGGSDLADTRSRCVKPFALGYAKRQLNYATERRWKSASAKLIDSPAYSPLELARSKLGESDCGDLRRVGSVCDHHRHTSRHQRSLASARRRFDQNVRLKIRQRPLPGLQVWHAHELPQSLSSGEFTRANGRRLMRRYASKSAGMAMESASKNTGVGPGAICPLRCSCAPAAVKEITSPIAFASSSWVKLSVRAGSSFK